jgi:hypothetical protein
VGKCGRECIARSGINGELWYLIIEGHVLLPHDESSHSLLSMARGELVTFKEKKNI